ncbi:hypothetical protein OPW33_24945 [Vibrio europaeus]|uniref:hypothetical protein n=1 Tax=Vibrio europaeus TaxID=300876 RepID=UPI002340EA66|nr:hypothetical protein [Vibrio europaeus]MDC5842554.1 hypothetical protein [Vibrio europaeus]
MASNWLKRYVSQILVGLFITVIGGVIVTLITEGSTSSSKFFESINSAQIQLNISGDQNSIRLYQGDSEAISSDLSVEGDMKDLEYFFPAKRRIEVRIYGQMNKLVVAREMKSFVFVQDKGDMTKILYR